MSFEESRPALGAFALLHEIIIVMSSDPNKKDKSYFGMFGNLRTQDIKALGIGLELAMVIGGLAYGGHWLDQKWDTDPWMLLTGVILGTLGGGWHAMKMANGGKLPELGLNVKTKKTGKHPGSSERHNDSNPTP